MSKTSVPSFDLTIDRGVPYVLKLTYYDADKVAVNVSGYTGHLKIRDRNKPQSDSYVSFPITFGGANGKLEAVIDTAQLAFNRGEYVVDVTPPSGTQFRLLKGYVAFDEVWT